MGSLFPEALLHKLFPKDFPIWWAAMLGFVVAAISPAVVVPSLLQLQERRTEAYILDIGAKCVGACGATGCVRW